MLFCKERDRKAKRVERKERGMGKAEERIRREKRQLCCGRGLVRCKDGMKSDDEAKSE